MGGCLKPTKNKAMRGTITTTPDGNRVELKPTNTPLKTYAVIYQLDEFDERIKLYGKDEYLEGRMSLGETKMLDL